MPRSVGCRLALGVTGEKLEEHAKKRALGAHPPSNPTREIASLRQAACTSVVPGMAGELILAPVHNFDRPSKRHSPDML